MGIKGSPDIHCYRNKMEFSFGDNGADGELCLGMRKRESNYGLFAPCPADNDIEVQALHFNLKIVIPVGQVMP